LFCCGGLVWLLFVAHYFIATPLHDTHLLEALAIAAVLGTHTLGETHTVATLVRVYNKEDSRQRFSLYTHWAALAFGALALAGLFVPGVTAIMAKIYLLWVVQHFTAQTYGLFLLYCYKNNYTLNKLEKNVLFVLMNTTAAFAILRQLTYKEWSANGFLGQKIPFWGPIPPSLLHMVAIALALIVVAFTLLVLRKAITQKQVIPLPAALLVFTGLLIFVVAKPVTGILWLYVPAFYHGSQYLVLTSAAYFKEKRLPDSTNQAQLVSMFLQSEGLRYHAFLILGAVFLYIGVPRLLQEFGFDYALTFATIFTVVNLHHFLTDQAIWKLRDPKLRQLLVS
jgi:hypothetical protein